MPNDVDTVRALLGATPDVVVTVPGTARVVAADVDGTPDGVPVLYVHGTPDSRLARHPDASIARDLGVRLVSVDRPGFGRSTPDPEATPTGWATDVTALLDALDVAEVDLLAWSAGALWTVGAAATLGARVRSLTVVGGLVPFEAFADPAVRADAGPARTGMIETAEELGAEAAADMIAPLLVPDPATPEAMLEHRAEAGDPGVDAIPGARARMAAACADAVRTGTTGLVRDVTVQFTPSGIDTTTITAPARFLTGTRDTTCPPAFARWWAAHVPGAEARIVPDAGHGLLLTHWAALLGTIVRGDDGVGSADPDG